MTDRERKLAKEVVQLEQQISILNFRLKKADELNYERYLEIEQLNKRIREMERIKEFYY
jgi:uncharacterized protein with PhoU and TrkA domain